MKDKKMQTEGAQNSLQSPLLGDLDIFSQLVVKPSPAIQKPLVDPKESSGPKKRIDIRLEKAHRGGKVVTVVMGEGIEAMSKDVLIAVGQQLRKQCGVGGTVKDSPACIEIQGDHVQMVMDFFNKKNYRCVRTGG